MRIKALLVAVGVLAGVGGAIAATQKATDYGQALRISPSLVQLAANPGQTVTTNITLRNTTTGPLVISNITNDFAAKGEDGEPKVLVDEVGTTRYSLKTWVQPIPQFQLEGGEQKSFTVTIKVPSNGEPGGHYGVVRFTAAPPGLGTSGASLSASIGTLVLLTVNGDITHQLSLVDFYTGNHQAFFQNGPVGLTERIHNSGNVHESPVGYVVVKNWLGHEVAKLPVNQPPHSVLPDSVRRFTQTWNKKWPLGHFTATTTLTYGPTHKVLTGSVGFWVIPYKIIALIILVLVILYFIGRKGIKRYNQKIIEKARKSGQ